MKRDTSGAVMNHKAIRNVGVISLYFKVEHLRVFDFRCRCGYNYIMVQRTCSVCGKPFDVWQSHLDKSEQNGMFCSNACRGIGQRKRVSFTCTVCDQPFELRPAEVAKWDTRFCSPECRRAGRRVEKVCPVCGKTYSVPRSYADRYTVCSLECRMAETEYATCERCGKVFTVSGNKRRHCSEECRRPPVINTCLTCGKDFRIVPSMAYQKFCSPRCYRRYVGETEPERNVRLCLEALGEA